MNNIESIVQGLQENKVMNEEVVTHRNGRIYKPLFITGFKKRFLIFRIRLTILRIAINNYKNPIYWLGVIRYFIKLRKKYLGNNKHNRLVLVDDKYYMGLYTPGWKGNVFDTFILSQLDDYKPIPNKQINRFMVAFIAITKKCPLKCEHCYEWNSLNGKEVLTETDLNVIVAKIQKQGVAQIYLTGGEPMNRLRVLLKVLHQAEKTTDFWINTSGYNLTDINARLLKEAGLTGAVISLDHYIPEEHNQFRGNSNAFNWAKEAVKNANVNKLVTALSLCVTRDFVNKENLMAYMDLARDMKVTFVQLLEPKSVGHYEGINVSLSKDQIEIMEDFVLNMNFNTFNRGYPFINYHAFYQRRHGCFSAGYKGLYIDTDGDMNPCPFCHKKTGSVLDRKFEKNLELLRTNGCKGIIINQ